MADGPTILPLQAPSLADLAQALAAEFLTPANLQKLAKNGQNIALESAKDQTELAWKIGAALPVLMAKLVLGFMRGGEPQFDEMAKVAVDGLFGDAGVQRGRSKEFTATVSRNILEAITNGSRTTEPNEDAARHFLDVATHLEIEGWMISWISEIASSCIPIEGIGHLEKFGDLKDSIAKATGLGRLSRRALGPYVDTFITEPTRQALHKKFQPIGMKPGQAAQHYFRGFITFGDFYEVCVRNGLNETAIEALQYDARKYFNVGDVYLLQRFGVWSEAEAVQHLRESGLESDQAVLELQLADAKDLRAFQKQSSEVAIAAFASGAISQAQLDAELAGNITDPVGRDRLRFLAQKRRDLEVKDLSLGQAEQAVELDVWSITDYRAYLDRHNYGHDAALTLELMLLAKLKRAGDLAKARAQAAAERAAAKAFARQELEAKRAQLALEHADFSGTIAQAERLVVRGQVDPGRYRRVLIDHGYTSDDASDLMTLAQQDATEYAATLERRRQAIAKAAQQQLAVATLERAVKAGRLSLEDYRRELLARNFTDAQAQLLVDVLAADVAHQQAAEATRAAAAAKLAVKHLSLGQEELAVRRGLQTVDGYRAFLAGAGFSSADQTTLIALLQTTLANDARAEQLRARAAAKLEASHLSLAEEEKAVAQQLKTLDDYAAFLQAHDFTVDDVQTLVALLALKLGIS